MAELYHSVKMLKHYLRRRSVSVLSEIPAESERVCLVHTDIYPAASEDAFAGLKAGINEPVGFLAPGKKYIARVAELTHGVPAERRRKVRERLYAWNDLNAEKIGIVIYFAQLLFREASAHMTEVGVVPKLICILGIEHQGIVAHKGKVSYHALCRLHIVNCISRHIRHVTEHP